MEAEIAMLREDVRKSLSAMEERDDALRLANEQLARLEAELEANVEQIRVMTCRCDAAEGALEEAREQVLRLEKERGEEKEMLIEFKSDKEKAVMRLKKERDEAIMRLEKELSIVRVEKEILERRDKEDGEELTRSVYFVFNDASIRSQV